jgi:aryl-alcohol dehydrogenase-like predicted oxidoreductase
MGDRISVVGFGGWPIGGHGYGPVEDSRSVAAVHKALDLGITLFDTADVYGFGRSEEILAKALGRRIQDVVLATKFGVRWDGSGRTWKDCSPEYLRIALEGSLRRLKTDCLPLYQIHRHDGVTSLSDVFDALFRLREEGKIRHIGCSNIPSSVFRDTIISGKIDSAQLQYSLAYQDSSQDLVAYRGQDRMATLVYGVLARGLLTGKYGKNSIFGEGDTRGEDSNFRENMDRNSLIVHAIRKVSAKYRKTPGQVAIRWVLENPSVSCALVGVKSEEQVLENAGAVGWFLEKEDRDYLGALGI